MVEANKSTSEEVAEKRELVIRDNPADLLTPEYVEEFKRQVLLFKQFKIALLMITDEADWRDMGGKPYLEDSGIQKVAERVNLDFGEPRITWENGEDKLGKFANFRCQLSATWRGRERHDVGTGSTRDQFFAMAKGKRVPFEEIKILDVEKKSITNAQHRLLTKMLGLGGLSWDQLQKEAGIRPRAAIRYAGSERREATGSGGWSAEKSRLWGQILEIAGDDQEAAAMLLEYTRDEKRGFKGTSDPQNLTDAQVRWLAPRVQKDFESFSAAPEDGPPQEEPGAAG